MGAIALAIAQTGNKMILKPFMLEKQYRDYVWGRRPGLDRATFPPLKSGYSRNNVVAGGDYTGQRWQPGREIRKRFTGNKSDPRRIKQSLPVLVKLLDCSQWLSLQVHPNDFQAAQLEGAGLFGKNRSLVFSGCR